MPMKTKVEFNAIISTADDVFNSLKTSNPTAAIAPTAGLISGGDSEGAVAAVGHGRGQSSARRPRGRGGGWQGGRGNGANRGRQTAGRGFNSRQKPPPPDPNDKSTWGDPHPDGPPPNACMQHYRYGKSAWICRKKSPAHGLIWKTHHMTIEIACLKIHAIKKLIH